MDRPINIIDWDIWHVYSSFLDVNKINLEAAGEALVHSGLAACVLHRDGRTWWNKNDETSSGYTDFICNIQKTNTRITVKNDKGDSADLSDYAQEAWYQASYFRSNELRLCNESDILPPYIRAILGEFHLSSSEQGITVVIYPVIKLFENGVILVEFRVIAPNRGIDLNEFINRYVNLYSVSFDRVEVPPAISNLAPKVYHSINSQSFFQRMLLILSEQYHNKAIKEMTQEIKSGDFTAKLAPLTHEEGTYNTLSSLAQTLYSIVGFVVSKPRSNIGFLLKGAHHLITAGNFWCGRPHIYLIDFEGQKSSAEENIQEYGSQFGQILERYPVGYNKSESLLFLKNLRYFDDYSAFIRKTASLWVWSKIGKEEQQVYADANRGQLIYEQQATVEILEYGYMLHKALLERVEKAKDIDDVLALRWDVNHLRSNMAEVSNFGEIRDLLNDGWKELEVDELQALIAEGTSIRESQTKLKEARHNERIGQGLTIIFGIFAIPTLANEVLRPIWTVFNLWSPSTKPMESLYFIGIALLLVFILCYIVIYKKKS